MRSVIDRISENPTVVAIEDLLKPGPFHGRISELHSRLVPDDRYNRNLPKTPQHLSNTLTRLKPAIVKIGIMLSWNTRLVRVEQSSFGNKVRIPVAR